MNPAENEVKTGVDDILGRGSRFLLISACILLAWACIAPLGQAVISQGNWFPTATTRSCSTVPAAWCAPSMPNPAKRSPKASSSWNWTPTSTRPNSPACARG